LYQSACARYLVGVKDAETGAKRAAIQARFSTEKRIKLAFKLKGPF
jgi:hypothetical protein